MTPIQKQTFVKDWYVISASGHAADRDKAAYFSKVKKVLPDRRDFVLFCTATLEQSGATAAKYWKMAKAFERVPALATWRAIGWRGVAMLDLIFDDVNVAKIERVILDAGEPAAMPRSKWIRIVERFAPDVVAASRRQSTQHGSNAHKLRADLLAKAIRKLVAGAPMLLGMLTPREKREAGIEDGAKKVAV